MNTYREDQTTTREELWRAWVQKGKLRDAAAAWRLKAVAGIVIGLFAASTAVYIMIARQSGG